MNRNRAARGIPLTEVAGLRRMVHGFLQGFDLLLRELEDLRGVRGRGGEAASPERVVDDAHLAARSAVSVRCVPVGALSQDLLQGEDFPR